MLYLKIISFLIASLSGLTGLLYKFRDENDKITFHGKLLLILIFTSTVVGFISIFIEEKKSANEAKEQLTQTLKIINEFNRTQNPIEFIKLHYWVEIPQDNEEIKTYTKKIDSYISEHINKLNEFPTAIKGLHVTSYGIGNSMLDVKIDKKSDFYPKKGILIKLINSYQFNLFLKKTPIDPHYFFPLISSNGKFSSDLIAMNFIPDNDLYYNYKDKKLQLMGQQEFPSTLWRANGKIISILDLLKSQLLLLPTGSNEFRMPEKINKLFDLDLIKVEKSMNPLSIILSMRKGHELCIDGKFIEKSKYQDGYPVFYLIFPKSYDEMASIECK